MTRKYHNRRFWHQLSYLIGYIYICNAEGGLEDLVNHWKRKMDCTDRTPFGEISAALPQLHRMWFWTGWSDHFSRNWLNICQRDEELRVFDPSAVASLGSLYQFKKFTLRQRWFNCLFLPSWCPEQQKTAERVHRCAWGPGYQKIP